MRHQVAFFSVNQMLALVVVAEKGYVSVPEKNSSLNEQEI